MLRRNQIASRFCHGMILAAVLRCAQAATSQSPQSKIEGNSFISPENPKIIVRVDERLKYLGIVPFTIDQIAGGFRYIFVQADPAKHIQRMFVIQQEGFFPSINDTYKYPITSPARLGNADYQHSVILDDNAATIREEPGKEAAATQRFLVEHEYTLEPELVMSRYARPADAERKHEIIFFCFENLSSYGRKLADFAGNANDAQKESIKAKADENCRAAFHVAD